ncbi:hypothetical protein HMPREF0043_00647 [Actinobaculum sp. oral taxon 183 str. F0552]|nr:hypothetical protein HMPREF0043_00647 [Actinobaculum sp. oral taxon 183 str. F0552]
MRLEDRDSRHCELSCRTMEPSAGCAGRWILSGQANGCAGDRRVRSWAYAWNRRLPACASRQATGRSRHFSHVR